MFLMGSSAYGAAPPLPSRPPSPAPLDVALLRVFSPLPTALALQHPPEEVCAWAAPPSAAGFPANENAAPLVQGQLNPPNSCCTWVVSQWTSMLGQAARPRRCVCVRVHVCWGCAGVCVCVLAVPRGRVGARVRRRAAAGSWKEGWGRGQLGASSARPQLRGLAATASGQAKASTAEAGGPNW